MFLRNAPAYKRQAASEAFQTLGEGGGGGWKGRVLLRIRDKKARLFNGTETTIFVICFFIPVFRPGIYVYKCLNCVTIT